MLSALGGVSWSYTKHVQRTKSKGKCAKLGGGWSMGNGKALNRNKYVKISFGGLSQRELKKEKKGKRGTMFEAWSNIGD